MGQEARIFTSQQHVLDLLVFEPHNPSREANKKQPQLEPLTTTQQHKPSRPNHAKPRMNTITLAAAHQPHCNHLVDDHMIEKAASNNMPSSGPIWVAIANVGFFAGSSSRLCSNTTDPPDALLQSTTSVQLIFPTQKEWYQRRSYHDTRRAGVVIQGEMSGNCCRVNFFSFRPTGPTLAGGAPRVLHTRRPRPRPRIHPIAAAAISQQPSFPPCVLSRVELPFVMRCRSKADDRFKNNEQKKQKEKKKNDNKRGGGRSVDRFGARGRGSRDGQDRNVLSQGSLPFKTERKRLRTTANSTFDSSSSVWMDTIRLPQFVNGRQIKGVHASIFRSLSYRYNIILGRELVMPSIGLEISFIDKESDGWTRADASKSKGVASDNTDGHQSETHWHDTFWEGLDSVRATPTKAPDTFLTKLPTTTTFIKTNRAAELYNDVTINDT
eukprot:jgi/Psemu1/22678/gm1.22678_g